jgi:hypothetical protein
MRNQRGDFHALDLSSSETTAFNFGYFYRTIEEHINSFAAQEGCPFTVTDVALRLVELLETKTLREGARDSELVPEVRKNRATAGRRKRTKAKPSTGAKVHVRTRDYRTLKKSAAVRRRMSLAQQKRWAVIRAKREGLAA